MTYKIILIFLVFWANILLADNNRAFYQLNQNTVFYSDCKEGIQQTKWDFKNKSIELSVIPKMKMCDKSSNQAVNRISYYQGININNSSIISFDFNLSEGYAKSDQSIFLLVTPFGECKKKGKWHLMLGSVGGNVGIRFLDPASGKKVNLKTTVKTDQLLKNWNQITIEQFAANSSGVPLKISINDNIIFDNFFDSADCNKIDYQIANVRSNNSNAKEIQTLEVKNFQSNIQENSFKIPNELKPCFDYYNIEKNHKIIFFGPSTVDAYKGTCESAGHYLSIYANKFVDQFTDGGYAGFTNVTPSKKRMDYIIRHYEIDLNKYDWIIYNGTIDHAYKIGANEEFFKNLTDEILSADLKSGKFMDVFGEAINQGKQIIISSPSKFGDNLKEKKYQSIAETSVLINQRYQALSQLYANVHWLPLNDEIIDSNNQALYTDDYDGVHHSKLGAYQIGKSFAKYIKEIENEI